MCVEKLLCILGFVGSVVHRHLLPGAEAVCCEAGCRSSLLAFRMTLDARDGRASGSMSRGRAATSMLRG